MIRKINFKQPKYIFPLVVFIPLCALVYFVMQTFGGGEDAQQTVATDRINTELPQANAEEAGDKMYEMSRRFGDEDAFTAVGAIGEEQKKPKNWSTATAKTNSTSWMQRKRNASVSSRKWRNWKGRWPNPEDISIPLHTGTMLLPEIGLVMEAEPLHEQLLMAIPHKMTSLKTWKKSNAGVTNVRRPLKAGWVSGALTGMNRQRSSGRTPLQGSVRLKRNATAQSLSSSPVIPMRRSSTQ